MMDKNNSCRSCENLELKYYYSWLMPAVILLAGMMFLNIQTAFSQPFSRSHAVRLGLQGSKRPDLPAKVDKIAKKVLKKTGVPSASVAVVKNGKIVYVHAYGKAHLNPDEKADTTMRYAIGSISKQFTAASVLLLEQKGKISLDDPVSKWMPKLTKAHDITIREILSHTSGYRDFWPQDYVPPAMRKHRDADKVIHKWAEKPLDFAPGTKWQYSNTNYLIAGKIVEKISGEPIYQFVQQHILKPLHMTSVVNYDAGDMTDQDAKGYMRYGIGPLRPAIHEGSGWMKGAAELAMTPRDLAEWDISIIDQSLLQPKSYKQFEKEVLLKNGVGSGYALGLFVRMMSGHRMLAHSGEVSGFTAENMVFPDDSAAVVVLTNQMAGTASGPIARQIAKTLFHKQDAQTKMRTEQAKKIFMGLERGKINRSLFTHDTNAYFSKQAMKDFKSSLGPLGEPEHFFQTSESKRGGMIERNFRAVFPNRTLRVWTYQEPNGKLEQYQIAPLN
jgi:CubicO group peptidase (beta-lactamase class C family)